jgi:KUP system potassium uptake protein
MKLFFFTLFLSGGTFALYSLICRYANVNAIPSQKTEVMELSAYKLELPNKHQRRAKSIKDAFERSSFAKSALLCLALLGTCMVIGDGILTPCISGHLNFCCKFNVLVLFFFL